MKEEYVTFIWHLQMDNDDPYPKHTFYRNGSGVPLAALA